MKDEVKTDRATACVAYLFLVRPMRAFIVATLLMAAASVSLADDGEEHRVSAARKLAIYAPRPIVPAEAGRSTSKARVHAQFMSCPTVAFRTL
jgi:hypothetical protein